MVCNCIPPPPIFDLPPPPDPSLIWGVISDEPLESLQRIRLKSCEFNPFFNIFGSSIELGNSSETGLYLLIFIFTMIITACTCATCLLRYRKYSRKRAASSINSSKFNSSSDTIVTGKTTHFSYNSIKPPQHHIEISNGRLKMVPAGVLMYSSKSTSNIATSSPRAMPTATLIRSMPKRMPFNNFVARNADIRMPPEAYYTFGRHYEEISETPLNQSFYGSDNIVVDLSQNLRYFDALAYQTERRPPPTTRPPPPPENSRGLLAHSPDSGKSVINSNFGPVSPEFRDDLSSSTEPELERINKENEEQHMPRSRLGDIGGRESSYETSRLWHYWN